MLSCISCRKWKLIQHNKIGLKAHNFIESSLLSKMKFNFRARTKKRL